ncbi:MAG: hypothetical protein JKY65_04895 [Planctomycetes bacterium]|nr:hypothetical protein [Planctomycetota bacterium]
MTEVRWKPDAVQAFRQVPGTATPVGYLTKLNIGTSISLSADLPVFIGNNPAVSAAAVLSSLEWGGGPTDPLKLTGVVSAANKHAMGNISSQSLSTAKVTLRLAVQAPDPKDGTYFKAFHTGDADVKGFVRTRPAGEPGPPLELQVGTEPAPEPQSPVVVPFSLTVVPASEEMDFHVASANLQVQVWAWGVAVS